LKPSQPLVYYIHGGGFAMGSVDLDDRFCDLLSTSTGCIFVSVEYRLAPAFKHPIPLNDCVEGARWCVENAASLGAKAGPIVIAGKSAGGALAFATALRLIDEGRGGDVLGLVPCQPLTVHPDAVPEEFKDRYKSFEEHGKC
jgi:versiconal hemiacetal acetate esterase